MKYPMQCLYIECITFISDDDGLNLFHLPFIPVILTNKGVIRQIATVDL